MKTTLTIDIRRAEVKHLPWEPLPPADGLAEAQQTVAEVFQTQFEQAGTDDKLKLIDEAWKLALQTRDAPASVFALLSARRDWAVQAGDRVRAMRSVDRLGQLFDVDPLSQQADVLQRLLESSSKDESQIILETAAALSKKTLRHDRYDLAEQFVQLTEAAANRLATSAARNFAMASQNRLKSYSSTMP